MPDDYDRKPEPVDDDGLFELAEDPDALSPEPAAPLAPGVTPADDAPGLDPMADDLANSPASGEGGSGGRSHFTGDDPEYVNPELARIRREEQRVARAEEEAAQAAAKQKIVFGVIGGVLVLAVLLYFLVLS